MNHIAVLLQSSKTIFRFHELESLLHIATRDGIDSFLKRAKKNNVLFHIRHGLWALPNYDKEELACKLKSIAYISLEYVLYQAGIIFQPYTQIITCVSNNSKTEIIKETTYRYSKIRDNILFDTIGIDIKQKKMIASPERAFCDLLYLKPNISVENFSGLNFEKLKKIAKIYPKRVLLSIEEYIKHARSKNT